MTITARIEAQDKGSNPLSRPRRTTLLAVHLLASVGAVGVDVALAALGAWGVRGADPRVVYPAMDLVATSILVPLAVVALISGLVLAITARWGLVTYWWVVIKLAITATLTVVALLVVVPGLDAAAAAAAEPAGPVSDAARLRAAAAPLIATGLLTLNVVLGTAKPRWRVRRSA